MSDRKRVVYQEWLRDPDGAILPKPPPKGQRTENGIIWGHSLEDFFWIQRIPKINVLTIWTRSMIQTITEAPQTMNPPKIPYMEPAPRRIRPWPALTLPAHIKLQDDPHFGFIDKDCGHRHQVEAVAEKDKVKKAEWAAPMDVDKGKAKAKFSDGCGTGVPGPVRRPDASSTAKDAKDNDNAASKDAPAPEDDGSKSPQSTAASSGGWSSGSGEWDAARPTAAGDGPKEGENKSPDPTTGKAKDAKEGDVKEEKIAEKTEGKDGASVEQEKVPPPAVAASEPQDDPTHKPTPAPPPSPEPPIYNRLPKLEEFIPTAYFPDILYVNDPQGQSSLGHYGRNGQSAKTQTKEAVPRKYKRVWPRFDRDEEGPRFNTDESCASIGFPSVVSTSSKPELPKSPSSNLRIAHLDLSAAPLLGTGNHSVVHRASLLLPTPLTGRSPTGQVLVAAKTGFSNSEARQLLQNEGKIYGAFPKHLQEDWCGYNLVAPITHPVPVGAVVPKFYGYYVPVMEDVEREKRQAVRVYVEEKKAARRKEREEKKEQERKRKEEERKKKMDAGEVLSAEEEENHSAEEEKEEESNAQRETDEKFALQRFQRTASYREWEKQSPILLLEECGSPIESHKFTPDERSECFSLALRLPHAEFTQNSFYVRNILRQPGPLSVPPAERSDRTPSFRIIDFGRGEHWPYELKAVEEQNAETRRKKKMAVPTKAEMDRRMKEEEREKTQVEKCAKQWWEARDYEVRKAHAELQIQDFNY